MHVSAVEGVADEQRHTKTTTTPETTTFAVLFQPQGSVIIFLSNFLALLIEVDAGEKRNRALFAGFMVAVNVLLVLAVIMTSWFAVQQSVNESRAKDNTLTIAKAMLTVEQYAAESARLTRRGRAQLSSAFFSTRPDAPPADGPVSAGQQSVNKCRAKDNTLTIAKAMLTLEQYAAESARITRRGKAQLPSAFFSMKPGTPAVDGRMLALQQSVNEARAKGNTLSIAKAMLAVEQYAHSARITRRRKTQLSSAFFSMNPDTPSADGSMVKHSEPATNERHASDVTDVATSESSSVYARGAGVTAAALDRLQRHSQTWGRSGSEEC